MSEVITKEVAVSMTLNGIDYVGTVSVKHSSMGYSGSIIELNTYDGINDFVLHDDFRIGEVSDLIRWEGYHQAGFDNVSKCELCDYYFPSSKVVILHDGRACYRGFAWYFDIYDEYYLRDEVEEHRVRSENGTNYVTGPSSYFDGLYYCDSCDCYVDPCDWDSDGDCCCYCSNARNKVIDDYCESHRRPVVLFGDYKDADSFVGLGFELEVDCNSDNSRNNNEVAKELCSTVGLAEDEMRYAHDGSLNYGFECISQPHTVKDFWSKQDKWANMLKYLVENGYRSHDTDTCGLHIHVSRLMFGNTKELQDEAIAKVYTFFDQNWDDLVLVSRRRNFNYCDKNKLEYYQREEIMKGTSTRLKQWRKKAKGEGGHYVALNNANRNTFEYRLGRGTLNAWSFFSWVDLIVTITKNAKRITVGKVNSNDLVSWLGGIKETTAKYIYKRGAFRDTMLALYPSIEWEFSNDDNRSDYDD